MIILDEVGKSYYDKLKSRIDPSQDDLLKTLCVAFSVFVIATKAIQEKGAMIVTDFDMVKPNPASSLWNQAHNNILKNWKALGFDVDQLDKVIQSDEIDEIIGG